MRKFIVCTLVIAAIAVAGWIWANNYVYPSLFSFAEMQVDQDCRNIFNDALTKTIVNTDNNLIDVQKDGNGEIVQVSANADGINSIENQVLSYAQNELSNLKSQGVTVNLGTAVSGFVSGLGPDIRINVQPQGNMQASYSTSYESAGINQTRLKIFMNMKEEMLLLVGMNTKDIRFSSDILICDTIVPGNIPSTNGSNNSKILKLIKKETG